MLNNKLKDFLRDVRIIYGKRILFYLFFSTIISLLSSLGYNKENIKEVYSSTFSFFTGLIVIEIAFFSIFISGIESVKQAKEKLVNSDEGITLYHQLLVKNYTSLMIKFFTVFILYLFKMFNLENSFYKLEICKKIFILGTYNLIYIFVIFSVIVTLDLVLSIYYLLWKK